MTRSDSTASPDARPDAEAELAATVDAVRGWAAGLAAVDTDAVTAQRIRAGAQAQLAAPPRPAAQWLGRWVEPTVVAGLAASYLVWAIEAVLAVYR